MKYKNRKIALTGATGTLGVSIVNQCIEDGIEVIAFVNPGSSNINRLPKSDLVTIVPLSLDSMGDMVANLADDMKADLEDNSSEGSPRSQLKELKADAFIHLAWGSTNRAVRNNMKPQVDNIRYSLDSVELAAALGCSVYVGAGSQAEYGRYSVAINEETVPHPESAYGMAKLCSGQMTRSLCKDKGMRHVWPRIFSTYGPNSQETTIINYTIKSILRNERPSLTGCDQMWDFIYVDDAARALLLLADEGKDGEVYNIASGKINKMKDYILMTATEVSRKLSLSGSMENNIGFGDVPYNDNTVMHLEGDISKISSQLGFVPMIDFEEGIRRTVEWAEGLI